MDAVLNPPAPFRGMGTFGARASAWLRGLAFAANTTVGRFVGQQRRALAHSLSDAVPLTRANACLMGKHALELVSKACPEVDSFELTFWSNDQFGHRNGARMSIGNTVATYSPDVVSAQALMAHILAPHEGALRVWLLGPSGTTPVTRTITIRKTQIAP